MDLSQALSNYIGRTIEAYYRNEIHVGTLIRVESTFAIIRQPGPYTPSDFTVFFSNVEYIRIRAA